MQDESCEMKCETHDERESRHSLSGLRTNAGNMTGKSAWSAVGSSVFMATCLTSEKLASGI